MHITKLPYDITTNIVHLLEQSAADSCRPLERLASLNACSLIAPGPWLQSARSRYWTTLEVPYDSTKGFQDMKSLFSSPLSTFHLSNIRSLHYGSSWNWRGRKGYTPPQDRSPVDFLEWCGFHIDENSDKTIAEAYFGHLESLHFKNVYILENFPESVTNCDSPIRPRQLSSQAKFALLNSFKTVTRLHLRSKVVFSTEEQFVEILSSFPALEVSTNFYVEFERHDSHVYQLLPCDRRSVLRLREFEWYAKPGDVNDNLLDAIADLFSLSTAPKQKLALQETYGNHDRFMLSNHYDRHPTTCHLGFLSKIPSLSHLQINVNQSNFENKYLHEMLLLPEPHPSLTSLEVWDLQTATRKGEIDEAIKKSLPNLESVAFLLTVVLPPEEWRGFTRGGDDVVNTMAIVERRKEATLDSFADDMPYCREKGLLCPIYRLDDSFVDDVEVEEWDWGLN
ncbi:hypothetical protein V5O48_007662 [Marasmius crinis-equi]|uniref:F-box domain-containing protein n=1 Tax=Marasmius crinis-equi TaxID=585013 RepID=A0ABR3FG68_9AGAR